MHPQPTPVDLRREEIEMLVDGVIADIAAKRLATRADAAHQLTAACNLKEDPAFTHDVLAVLESRPEYQALPEVTVA